MTEDIIVIALFAIGLVVLWVVCKALDRIQDGREEHDRSHQL